MTKTVEFKGELSNKLEKFEKYRQKMNRLFVTYKTISKLFKFVYYPGLAAAVATAALPVILPFTLVFIIISAGLFILDMVLYRYVFRAPEVRFRDKFKTEVVAWVMKKINPAFSYEPKGKIDKESIAKSQVFKSSIDLYNGEDLVKGTIEGIDFQFGEAELFVDKETFKSFAEDIAGGIFDAIVGNDGDEGDTANYVKFFKGFIMHANFGKQEAGSVLVIPTKVAGKGLFRKDYFNGKKRFSTNDAQFDKQFSCYTTQNIDGLAVINPEFRTAILELVNTVQSRVYVSLVNGSLFVGIDWDKDLFEADLKQGISAAEDVEFVIQQIKFFEYLTKRMALDHIIWL